MTDGIIQQTFEPYLIELHEIVLECRQEDNSSEYTRVAEQRLDKLMKLQQELIEKIDMMHPLHDSAFCSNCELKKWLIGDNKE